MEYENLELVSVIETNISSLEQVEIVVVDVENIDANILGADLTETI
jgi:hypothetical protein